MISMWFRSVPIAACLCLGFWNIYFELDRKRENESAVKVCGMNYLKREHIRKETERAWTTTLNLCFQQIGVNLFIGWCFLGDWKAREKLELWLLHPYTIFFLYRHLQLPLCLRSWQNFMGAVLGWYWAFLKCNSTANSRQKQMLASLPIASRGCCLPGSTKIPMKPTLLCFGLIGNSQNDLKGLQKCSCK